MAPRREGGNRRRIAGRTALVGDKPIHLAVLVRFPCRGKLGVGLSHLAGGAVGKAPVDHGREALGWGNPKPNRRAPICGGAGRLAEPLIRKASVVESLGGIAR